MEEWEEWPKGWLIKPYEVCEVEYCRDECKGKWYNRQSAFSCGKRRAYLLMKEIQGKDLGR